MAKKDEAQVVEYIDGIPVLDRYDLEFLELNPKVEMEEKAEFESLAEDRIAKEAQLSILNDSVKDIKERMNTLMSKWGVLKLKSPRFSYNWSITTRKSLNQDKLKQTLALHMPVDLIAQIFEECTDVTTTPTYTLRIAKEVKQTEGFATKDN